jgi:hypothetical protein
MENLRYRQGVKCNSTSIQLFPTINNFFPGRKAKNFSTLNSQFSTFNFQLKHHQLVRVHLSRLFIYHSDIVYA